MEQTLEEVEAALSHKRWAAGGPLEHDNLILTQGQSGEIRGEETN